MKKNQNAKLTLLFLIILISAAKTFALDYNINFTGKGASTIVDKVIVQNLTKNTTVTILADGILNLTDETTGFEQQYTQNNDINIYSKPDGNTHISFYVKKMGNTQINVFNIDGRKIAAISTILPIGENSFQLQLPRGLFAIQITGNGYTYSEKIITQSSVFVNTGITYIGSQTKTLSAIQKIKKTEVTKLSYSDGDLLLYKGFSGNNSTLVTDIPTTSKTQNFDFVECKDASGNYYSVVKIGSQTWMAENIKTSKFRNGDDIMNITNNTDWGTYTISSWCNYNHDATTGSNYGKLYNWFAVSDSRNIAPVGWHMATDTEWSLLTTFLGGESSSGGKLKQTDIVMWSSPNTLATNQTGFTALPAGRRLTSGQFSNIGLNGYWWSLTENGTSYAWYRHMQNSSSAVVRDYYNKNVGFSVRCVKDAELPTLTTTIPTSITYTTALGGGDITFDGGAPITARGVCWSLTSNPTILNNKSTSGNGNGTFTSSITGLNVNTTYYVRAYATNSSGTAYGEQVVFNSKPYDNLTAIDADGNLYHSITIGNQIWMVENLKTTKYRNGDVIGTTSSINLDLTYATNPKYQWAYNGLESNVANYGRLYTWHVVADTRNIAPEGWHVASDAEWTTLQNYLIANGYNYDKTTIDNKTAKSLCSTTLWNSSLNNGATGCDLTLNNTSGFTMTPSGYRGYDGYYYLLGNGCDLWTSTDYSTDNAIYRAIGYSTSHLQASNLKKNYGFSVRCIKNTTPSITTNAPITILSTTASCSGNITSDGGDAVTEFGICWNTTENPTITENKKTASSGTGTFSTTITGLEINTTYYVRAYATNSLGTSYGQQFSFKTLITDPPTVTDIDGNVYTTVTIGNQVWMVENLKVTKYNDGNAIPNINYGYDWGYMNTPAYCWYNNDIVNKNIYGALYNWHAINTNKLCPQGWHVPSNSEWTELTTYLGGLTSATTKLKEAGNLNWISNTATNESKFTAVPGGYRRYSDGTFFNLGSNCSFWSSSSNNTQDAWSRAITLSNTDVQVISNHKSYGISVRCIKNTLPSITTNPVTSILTTSASCGGNISSNGGETVTEYGVCWSKTENPTIADSKKSIGNGNGAFSSSITGLDINTTYYVRAYATNSIGTAYGQQLTLKTLATDPITVIDVDGNLYHTVTIGNQTWMVENLKTTRYKNGDVIETTSSIYQDITYTTNPKYQWPVYGNETNVTQYGRLYTWHTVADSRNIAPEGWRIASAEDWTILQNYLIANGHNYDNTTVDNKIAKSLCSTTLWNTNSNVGTPSNNLSLNNSSGFSAVPSGYRGYDGSYYLLGNACYYWTTTNYSLGNAEIRYMGINNANLMITNSNKNYGYSVRCIKN